MNVIEKAQRSFLFVKFLLRLAKGNRDKIREIQKKHGFTKQRITRIHFMDSEKHYDFIIKDGKLTPAWRGKPQVQIYIKEFCTLKHLASGSKLGLHPSNGEECDMNYTMFNAWCHGDVSTYGEASTNDMLASLDVFVEIINLIPQDDIVKLVGPCDHDKKKG